MRIAVTGSYNGQDSLGDECLMRAVLGRLRRLRPDAEIALQLHAPEAGPACRATAATGARACRGLQSAMWRTAHVLGRMGIPSRLAKPASERGIRVAAGLGLFGAREAVRQLEACDAFFVYGGSQFAASWFSLNAPAYLASAEMVHGNGGRVFFGPQQFGPLAPAQAFQLADALGRLVTDWRTRNPQDLSLLGATVDGGTVSPREIYDEVFAATEMFPAAARGEAARILVNLRAMTFDDERQLEPECYRAIAGIIDGLVAHYDLPAVFFAVSDASFCDDDRAFMAVRALSRAPARLSTVGRVRDAGHLVALAAGAQVALSMSFHGCLLAAIAGAPFVAVSEGDYYGYKYAGFAKYAGGQDVPVIGLSSSDVATDLERIVAFVDGFDHGAVRDARTKADARADAFYGAAVGAT